MAMTPSPFFIIDGCDFHQGRYHPTPKKSSGRSTARFADGLRWPGLEPGSTAWQAAMLPAIPPTPHHFLPRCQQQMTHGAYHSFACCCGCMAMAITYLSGHVPLTRSTCSVLAFLFSNVLLFYCFLFLQYNPIFLFIFYSNCHLEHGVSVV